MRKPKTHSKLYAYLEKVGVLDGTEEEIRAAKKKYRKNYLKNYKRNYRNRKKHIELILEEHEQKTLAKAAKRHGYTLAAYCKKAALHYIEQKYLVPYPETILEIKQLVYQTRNEIQNRADRERGKWYSLMNDYESLQTKILEVYTITQNTFENPISLKDYIKKEYLGNPEILTEIKEILAEYDC